MANSKMPSLNMYFTLEVPIKDVPLVNAVLQELELPEDHRTTDYVLMTLEDHCRVVGHLRKLKEQVAAAAKQLEEEPSDG